MLVAALSGYASAAQRRAELIRRSLAALATGRLHEAYLLADISCQAGSAAPDDLLLRATIAARLGCPGLEMADVEAAYEADPSLGSTRQGMLAALARRGYRERGDVVARDILRLGTQAELIGPAIAALELRAGCAGVALCHVSATCLAITIFSPREQVFELGLDFGCHKESVQVATRREHAPAGFGGAAGRAAAAWPEAARIAILSSQPPLDCPGPPPMRPHFKPGSFPAPVASGPLSPVVPVTVIMPVHGACEMVRDAIDAVLAGRGGTPQRLVLVNDRPDAPDLGALLAGYAGRQGVAVITNRANLGFVASVNAALVACPEGDVVLLNDDTVVPAGWLDRLFRAANDKAGVGTVTPLSNNGELTSVPAPFGPVPMPAAGLVAAIDRLASALAPGVRVALPNGVGFCLYVTHACRTVTGLLDDAGYRDGYLEEVDYCLRAAELGFTHIAACDVFVGHAGGASFGPRKRGLVAHNRARLERAFPEAGPRSRHFVRADPLHDRRIALQEAILRAGLPVGGSATLVIGRAAIAPDGMADLPGLAKLARRRALLRLQFGVPHPLLHRDGAMAPHRLPLDLGEDKPAAALARMLRGQAVREIVYLDALHPVWARELPGLLGVPYAVRAVDDSVVSQTGRDRSWASFLAGAAHFVSASPDLAVLAVSRGLRVPVHQPLRLASGRALAPARRDERSGSLAVFMDVADRAGWTWLRDLARRLVKERWSLELTVFGATRDDDGLRNTGTVIVTGMPLPALATESFALHRCVATLALLPAGCIEHPALAVIARAPRPLLSWNPYLPAVLGCAARDFLLIPPHLSAEAASRRLALALEPAHG